MGDDPVLGAAILMPAGFLLSVVGSDPDKPIRLFVLVLAGVRLIQAGLAWHPAADVREAALGGLEAGPRQDRAGPSMGRQRVAKTP